MESVALLHIIQMLDYIERQRPSSEYPQKLLALGLQLLKHLLHILLLLQVHLVAAHLVRCVVAVQRELVLLQGLKAIATPRIGQRQLIVHLDSFLKATQRFLDLARTQVSSALVVVVDGVVGLQFDGFVMAVDRHFVVLEAVVAGSQIAMVRRDLSVQLYCVFDVLDFFVVISHLSDGLPLEMPKLALFS